RAGELAEIVTGVHGAIAEPEPEPQPESEQEQSPSWTGRYRRTPGSTWWLHAVSRAREVRPADGVQPSMARFLSVAGGQTVSMLGSALTEFAIPIWVYAR